MAAFFVLEMIYSRFFRDFILLALQKSLFFADK